MRKTDQYIYLIIAFIMLNGSAQEIANNYSADGIYKKAHLLAYDGEYTKANSLLSTVEINVAKDNKPIFLLARTESWMGNYAKARAAFNLITSADTKNVQAWIAAIKNELYANNNATALGLANKALYYLQNEKDIERLKFLAIQRIENQDYPKQGWYNDPSGLLSEASKTKRGKKVDSKKIAEATKGKAEKLEPKNRISVRNSFNIFNERYDPMIASNIAYKRQTKFGAIIPKINYANRLGNQGVQFDLDMYPKLAKKIYAYVNYGFSNASIYPNHKMTGEVYFSLPGAFEFSAGGRHMIFDNRNVSVINNSLGRYMGNYYLSLRSYITPREGNLSRISGNFVVRKYLKDGENFFGFNIGMGYSPELKQFISDGVLLAETLLYIESQRAGLEYQFTVKNSPNVYRTNIGITRQELSFDTGSFFWGFSAGLTYNVKF